MRAAYRVLAWLSNATSLNYPAVRGLLSCVARVNPATARLGNPAAVLGAFAGAVASAAVCFHGPGGLGALQSNFGTHAIVRPALYTSTKSEKFETTFSYDGWQMDAELAEKRRSIYSESRVLDTMRRKQQVHDGDHSHPFIRKLDALTPTLSCPAGG